MKKLTVEKYEEAILYALTEAQRNLLKTLIQFPAATATARQLTDKIAGPGKAHVIINGLIGNTGKAIERYFSLEIEEYGFLAPYELIGYHYKASRNNKRRPGWEMHKNLQKAVINLGLYNPTKKLEAPVYLSTEEMASVRNKYYEEGKLIRVMANRYERDNNARRACISHYGCSCYACNFDFGAKYGKDAEGYIQVHHIVPLHTIRKNYKVDPINDLIPLCANCHAAIHMQQPAMSVDKLKRLIKKASK